MWTPRRGDGPSQAAGRRGRAGPSSVRELSTADIIRRVERKALHAEKNIDQKGHVSVFITATYAVGLGDKAGAFDAAEEWERRRSGGEGGA